MDAYIGNSVFYDRTVFSDYNISVPGLTAWEIMESVLDHPPIWGCFDKIMLSSMGNDALRSLDPLLAEKYLRQTIDALLDSGAKKIILLELPLLDHGIISAKHDDPRYLAIARDYDRVFLAADIYREQLIANPASDGIHLSREGNQNLYHRLQEVANKDAVYDHIIQATGNHLGADILERSGITLEFARHLVENCRDWICAYQETVDAGYIDIMGIVSSYDEQVLYKNFIDI
jgi:hypothetical protein